jgi:hypothetical protein
MKIFIIFIVSIFWGSWDTLVAQKHSILIDSHTFLINKGNSNLREVKNLSGFSIKFVTNNFYSDLQYEKLSFVERAIVLESSDGSTGYLRNGSEYDLDYLTVGLGVTLRMFTYVRIATGLRTFILIQKNWNPKLLKNDGIYTFPVNRSGSSSIQPFKMALFQSLTGEFTIFHNVYVNTGFELQAALTPIVFEDDPYDQFRQNNSVQEYFNLKLLFGVGYRF